MLRQWNNWRGIKKALKKQITEKTKDLQQHIELLQKSNQDLESFAYAASHDLAEPLRNDIKFSAVG